MSDQDSPGYRYWAFISYSSKDKKWGRWLHRAIETYRIPTGLVEHQQTPTGYPAPKRFYPLFRDRDELAASSDLGTEIEKALRASHYLIVVCSPFAAQSKWVNREIETFQSFARTRILAVIVDSEPHAAGARELFPPSLRQCEPIAADARPGGDGKTNAKLKLVAGMLGVSFDSLKQRDTHRRIRYLQKLFALAVMAALSLAGLAAYAFQQRDKALSARWQAESVLQFLVYDMRDELEKVGRLELVAKIQKRVDEYHRQLGTEESQPVTLRNRAVALDNAGTLAADRGDLTGAVASYWKALGIVENLARQEPGNADRQSDLSISYDRLGSAQRLQGESAGALISYRKALGIAENLARHEPGNTQLQHGLGSIYENLGDVQSDQGDVAGALISYRKALGIAENLARQEPANADRQIGLSDSHERLGLALREQGDLIGALTSCGQAVEICERLAKEATDNTYWQNKLSGSYWVFGDMQRARGDLAGALNSYQRALGIAKKLTQQDPGNANWERDLSIIYERLGDLQSGNHNPTGALASYRQAAEIRERVAKQGGNAEARFAFTVSSAKVGDAQRALGDLAGALARYREVIGIVEKLTRQDPGNTVWRRFLGLGYDRAGDVQSARNDMSGALASYKQALEIRERLAGQDSGNRVWQRDLWVTYNNIALVMERGSIDGAREWSRKAFEQLSEMKKRGLSISAEDEKTMDQLRQRAESGTATNR
jgi:tetratricopeptide (TPR) repeat protein